MYQASDNFHLECKQLSRRFKGYVIAFIDGIEHRLNSTDYLISMDFTDDIYSDRLVGSFVAKTMNLKVYNDLKLDFENAEIEAYMGVDIDEDITEYVPMGRFIVETVAFEKVGNIATINCMDSTIKFNVKLKDLTILNFPTTLDGLITQISAFVGVEFVSGTIYPNHDLNFSEQPYLSLEWSCRDIITYLVEACGCYAKINRENKLIVGTLDLNINKGNQSLYTIDKSMYSEITIDKRYGVVNSIVLSREPQEDNVYKKDDVSIEEHGLTEIQITNNYFIDPQIADSTDIRYTTIVPIYNQLNGFFYYPFNCKAFGNPSWDSGDIILIQDTDDNIYPTMITQLSTTYSGGFRQILYATALTDTQTDYDKGSTIYDRMNNVELVVDKQNGIIQSIITSTTRPKVTISATAPINPTEGEMWFDISDIDNPILKIFNGEIWVSASTVDVSGQLEVFYNELLEYVQGELAPIIEQNAITSENLDKILNDSYVTVFEKLDLESTFTKITTEYQQMLIILDNYQSDLFPNLEAVLTNKYTRLSMLLEPIFSDMNSDTNLSEIDMPVLPEIDDTLPLVEFETGEEIPKMSYQVIRNAIDEYYIAYQNTYGTVAVVTKTELNTVTSELKQTNDQLELTFKSAQFAEGVAKDVSNHFKFNDDGTFEIFATVSGVEQIFKTVISNTKIEFQESGVPVAYLSNQELVITTANIKNMIRLGKMAIVSSSNDGIVFKWEGE